MKALPKNLLEDRGKEREGVLIRLSTDMILKPWYWEPESPWIHISKTLILAPLTAGLAFTLTSRQLLLQICHGNFILLTICFTPPPLSPFAGLRLLTGLPCVPIRIRSERWINTWSWFSSFSKKKKSSYPPFLVVEVGGETWRKRAYITGELVTSACCWCGWWSFSMMWLDTSGSYIYLLCSNSAS